MNPPMTSAESASADARWLAWKVRGAKGDRRSAIVMGWLFAILAVVLGGWLVGELL